MANLTVGKEKQTPIELYYEDYGEGEPVVLIHGWPSSSRSWELQVLPLVQNGYRVITYDRRGFGASSHPWSGYDYDTLAADLHEVLEQLDLQNATLVGFSMGGGEVARYVSTYGTDRVKKAVFAAAVPPYLYKESGNPDGGMDDDMIANFDQGIKQKRLAFLDDFVTNFFAAGDKTDLVSESFRQYNKTIASFASPKGTLDSVYAFGKTDFRKDLEAFEIPTLVIHGDADNIVPYEVSGKRTYEAIPGCELSLIEGGPHGLYATHPDEFNEALLSFLNQ